MSIFLLLLLSPARAADYYWVATKAGNWSARAHWAATSGGPGGAGVPGTVDRAFFDGGGQANGDVLIDADAPAMVGNILITSAYTGTLTQTRDLTITGDLSLGGGSTVGWTFPRATTLDELHAQLHERPLKELDPELETNDGALAEDTPATLTVHGTLTIAVGKTLTCPRSATDGEGKGRTISVGKDLIINGVISADGQGLQLGPGTPKQPTTFTPQLPIAPSGAGYGGLGSFLNVNNALWRGGKTYGSVTAPVSLGSGAPAVDLHKIDVKDVLGNSPLEFWSGEPAVGGGAVTLTVAGAAVLSGRISANGKMGDTGASGGSIYLTASTLSGTGSISADGSNGPTYGGGRGPGGGGRIAVRLTKGAGIGTVAVHAFGGIGRLSTPAAAGTIFVQTTGQTVEQGTLIIDNHGQLPRSLLEAVTSLPAPATGEYTFAMILLRNAGVLYLPDNVTVKAARVSTEEQENYGGVVLLNGTLSCPTIDARRQETLGTAVQPGEQHQRPLTVLVLGKAYSVREELLARCFTLAYYPSLPCCRITANLKKSPLSELTTNVPAMVTVVAAGQTTPLAQDTLPLAGAGTMTLSLPELPDGVYEARVTLPGNLVSAPLLFKRKHFVWEQNTLGITDKVYPPFEPLSVHGDDLLLSQRAYRMNGFGLFDAVTTLGRNLLAAPISLHLETAQGMSSWTFGEQRFMSAKPNVAVYQATATAGPLKVVTRNTIEFDGCAKVEMDLQPSAQPGVISRLWLEIPLKDAEVPLFHNAAFEAMRRDYSGITPRGGKIAWGPRQNYWVPPAWSVENGTAGQDPAVIWTAADTRPWSHPTVNDFVPYLWLGAAERGLAWFAANDKGWISDNTKPAQVITREGDRVVVRIYLINKPVTLTVPRHLVFGLQASPTRPMLKDWRTVDYQGKFPWNAMCPIGAAYCADKYPLDGDFSLVDHWLNARKEQEPNYGFFKQKADSLLAQGAWPAVYTPKHWLDKWDVMAPRNSMSIYFEEHWTSDNLDETAYFRDEWFGGAETYAPSHRDFCLYYANEFLKRGISLYFDNTFLKTSFNTLMNEAYVTEDGRVQPAVTLWEQREYYRRIWNLLSELNAQHPEWHLKFTQHMTNELILPHCTWATETMDNEWTWLDNATGRYPAIFPPEVLLAEMTGRQTGTQGNALHPISAFEYRTGMPAIKKNQEIPPYLARREWGMRMVHEIRRGTPSEMSSQGQLLEQLLRNLGYGQPDARIVNYWEDAPPVSVENNQVKWLAVLRETKSRGALVLQSYLLEAVTTRVHVPGARVLMDSETREFFPLNAQGDGSVTMPQDFSTRVLLIATAPEELPVACPAGTIFFEDFELGLNPMWGPLNGYFTPAVEQGAVQNHVLTVTPSREPGGPYPGISVSDGLLPANKAFETTFRFRIPVLPMTPNAERGALLITYAVGTATAGETPPPGNKDAPEENPDTPPAVAGKPVAFSLLLDVNTVEKKSYWALSRVSRDLEWALTHIPAGKFWKIGIDFTVGNRHGEQAILGDQLGQPDTGWHRLTFRVQGGHHTLLLDDHPFLDAESDAVVTPAFLLQTPHGGHAATIELDDIAIRLLPDAKQ